MTARPSVPVPVGACPPGAGVSSERGGSINVGPDGEVHLLVVRPQRWEAWSAPLAGGAAAVELPAPWSQLVPAPRGGWRAALQWRNFHKYRVRFLSPGAPLDDPSAREIEAWGWATWMPDGGSWVHLRDGLPHRFFVDTGEDRPIAKEGGLSAYAVSPDGETLYTTLSVPHVRRELIVNFAERR
jgi:hypothetical protein